MTNWKQIRKEFEENDITLKALAEKYGVKESTMRSRKNREGWQRNDDKTSQRNATDKPGGQRGNQNAKGNSGGGAPQGNKNAISHGLFANFLPKETLEIMTELHSYTPADMIWQNILIQYSAIIRAQKIMYVRDEQDNYSNVTGIKLNPMFADQEGNPIKIEENREWHMAYERYEKFMSAQSRAIGTLSNLIKQFVALADEDDKRKLELQSMQARIKLMEIKASEDSFDEDEQDDGFLDALSEEGAELWPEE